jgi:NADPH-dependent 2,4-dienoyl-CoA reductase/sulfur reductase-like enzyme
VHAARLVLATGAYDRHLPFPGWDRPGVLSAGGVQALLKEHGVLAGRAVVVAGTGPFLLPVADGLLRAGARVPLIAEANSPLGFLRHPAALAGAAGKLGEAGAYAARLARARVPFRRRHVVLRALGDDRVEAVEVGRLDSSGRLLRGSVRTIACDTLAVGWGFTPQLELHLQAGCETRLDVDGSLVVRVDDGQRTSVPGVFAAGESTGVGGWELASIEGEIAGAVAVGAPVDVRLGRRRAALRRFAAAMHTVHPVPDHLLRTVPSDTVVCRCEEVPAGAVRAAVEDLAATETRTVKLLTRTGMGWCQGRICGYATAQLTALHCARPVSEADLRAMAERPFAAPSTLATLADAPSALADAPDADDSAR